MSVQILLSTYNGERYLRPLLQSLREQDYPHVTILVRDDGSIDNTPALLREFATGSPSIEIVFGKHIGFVRSFFALLALASQSADYFAVCDQDDVWQSTKVSRAVEFLRPCSGDVPALYCSRLTVVNADLKPLGYSDIPKKALSFRNAIVENQARGCTSLLNQAARRLLTQIPSACVSHDWWIYLVVSAFGSVLYDSESRILYRQHTSNVFGIATGTISAWRTKIHQFIKDAKSNLIARQAEEFNRIYGSLLPDEHKRVIERFLDSRQRFWNRLRYACSCEVYRQSTIDQCILRARIALDCL